MANITKIDVSATWTI